MEICAKVSTAGKLLRQVRKYKAAPADGGGRFKKQKQT